MYHGSRAVFGGRFFSRAVVLGVLAVAIVGIAAGTAAAATFNPALVMSDGNMRAYDSMSQADIQAFLNTQPGPLKSLVTTDHATGAYNAGATTVKKPASQIIYEACRDWHVSPKVMLTMLQKEQSLLTRTSLDKNTLSRAIGAGCPNGSTNKYPGFGSQMYFGAKLLDGYGEGKNGSTIPLWKAPYTTVMDIYQHPNVAVKTANVATYKLFIYNPSIGAKTPYGDLSGQSCSGNANFWKLYSKYFGDPFADPRVRAVYRFQSRSNGGFFYTSSYADRYRYTNSKYWRYQGVAFSWDSTASPNASGAVNSVPVVRFYDRSKHTYLYTSSQTKIAKLRSSRYSKRYRYEGIVWRVTSTKTGITNVFCFQHRKSGTSLYTASPREKAKYLAAKKTYRYTGTFRVVQ